MSRICFSNNIARQGLATVSSDPTSGWANSYFRGICLCQTITLTASQEAEDLSARNLGKVPVH
jgi:hypothetical protein